MRISEILTPDRRTRGEVAGDIGGLGPGPHDFELVSINGRRVPVEVKAQTISRRGKTVAVQGIARDMQDRRRFETQLLHLASHDPLTELFNRRRFEQELQLEITRAKREEKTGAVVFFDLDHFKDVNDTLGHTAGDELLVAIGERLRAGLRQDDIVARLGGDEFTAIIPDVDQDGARRVANKILEIIRREPFRVAGQQFTVTASAGFAMIRQGDSSAAELLSHSDLAMYQAKEDGRNRTCAYNDDTDLDALMETKLGWRRRIWGALEQDRFVLYAQPIVELRSGKIDKYELLLRLREQHAEPIAAADFIDKAERFGLMPDIDRWVIGEAIRLLSRHDRQSFAINLSSRAFSDDQIIPLIRSGLAKASVDPSRLIIEVTESAAIENAHTAQEFVQTLTEIGCRFALDDFGAGYSSFYQLKLLNVNYLKIDGSLVRNIVHDQTDRHLVKAIIELARALRKEVIVEFVTDAETLELVRELGADYAQGYHIGRPGEVAATVCDPSMQEAA